jgi:UDP-glucose 4-epimerase
MEKILITGGSGFLGSWVTRVLCNSGYRPILLVRPQANLYRLQGLENLEIIKTESRSWPELVEKISPNSVIALDWSGVENSQRNENSQFINVERILDVAESAVKVGVSVYIGAGSQAEIGPTNSIIFEDLPTNPTTEYGRAKCQVRLGLEKHFENTPVQFTWGRIFSTYGPLDSPSWLIPQLILAFKSRSEFKMTKGEQNWNYLHAYDYSTAVLAILRAGVGQGTINIANPRTETIFNVAKVVASKMHASELLKIGELEYRVDQVFDLFPDVRKITSLGWEPEITFENGIDHLINWYLEKDSHLMLKNVDLLSLPDYRKEG